MSEMPEIDVQKSKPAAKPGKPGPAPVAGDLGEAAPVPPRARSVAEGRTPITWARFKGPLKIAPGQPEISALEDYSTKVGRVRGHQGLPTVELSVGLFAGFPVIFVVSKGEDTAKIPMTSVASFG